MWMSLLKTWNHYQCIHCFGDWNPQKCPQKCFIYRPSQMWCLGHVAVAVGCSFLIATGWSTYRGDHGAHTEQRWANFRGWCDSWQAWQWGIRSYHAKVEWKVIQGQGALFFDSFWLVVQLFRLYLLIAFCPEFFCDFSSAWNFLTLLDCMKLSFFVGGMHKTKDECRLISGTCLSVRLGLTKQPYFFEVYTSTQIQLTVKVLMDNILHALRL